MGAKAVGFLQGTTSWTDGSVIANPADTTTLVDTGVQVAGNYLIAVTTFTDAGTAFTIAVRQLDVSLATVHTQNRRIPAGGNDDWLFGNKLTLSASDRIRVIVSNGGVAVVGNVQCSIFLMECG